MFKKEGTELKTSLFLIVIFQIFLLINFPTANGYAIHQTDPLIQKTNIIKKDKI